MAEEKKKKRKRRTLFHANDDWWWNLDTWTRSQGILGKYKELTFAIKIKTLDYKRGFHFVNDTQQLFGTFGLKHLL
jgi:hypothetical protein